MWYPFLTRRFIEIAHNTLSLIITVVTTTILAIVTIILICLKENEKVDSMEIKVNSREKKDTKSKKNNKDDTYKSDITFDSVAGHQEVKEDLRYTINFMNNPEKYFENGARLPKGMIFYGPPGNGKTLIAKALAGEAGLNFIAASGSDFVEKYVGVGSRRVRDLFKKARKNAPCIVFIDEIDAVGGQRDGHNSERDQTVNALLTELDGFDNEEGILVIAATNRIDMLDPALIRTGRLDRHIAIPLPEYEDRVELLELYAKNKKLSNKVYLGNIARNTEGFSASDIANLLNEAAILATNREKEKITSKEIEDAFFKIITKGNKKRHNPKELEMVAYHEAGHALVAKLLGREVHKVTCVGSTSGIGGLTLLGHNRSSLITKEDLLNEVKILYGGRIAEYLFTGDINKVTTGASNDIKQATTIITKLINEFGMGNTVGLINTSLNISKEAKELSDNIYKETLELVETNYNRLVKLADQLIIKETILEDELEEILCSTFTKYA